MMTSHRLRSGVSPRSKRAETTTSSRASSTVETARPMRPRAPEMPAWKMALNSDPRTVRPHTEGILLAGESLLRGFLVAEDVGPETLGLAGEGGVARGL